MGYNQDGRPAKRPRNVSTSIAGENPHLNTGPVEDLGMGMKMTTTADSLKNMRLGHQPPTSLPNRGRTDDKNNRKLSCKECRRQVKLPARNFTAV